MYTYKPDKCKVPIKVWSERDSIEQSALEQIENAAMLPFVYHHAALMPDAHLGYGMPIGGVVALDGIISPHMVGSDIGCGMCAVKTSLTEIDAETIKKIFGGSKENKGGIRACVPVGFNHQNKKQDVSNMPIDRYRPDRGNYPTQDITPIVAREFESALKQLGTLGGGKWLLPAQEDNLNILKFSLIDLEILL